MATDGGREQLTRVQAQHAAALVQNHLSNPVGQHPQMGNQFQMGQQQHQQQLAAMQPPHMGQMQPPQGFSQGMMPNAQLTPQQLQQLQLRQLAQVHQTAQAQANMARPPPSNATQAQVVQAQAQIQALARAQAQAQNHLLQAAQQMGQNQHMMDQVANTPNFGSPRPQQQAAAQRTAIPPERIAQLKMTVAKIGAMTEPQREMYLQQVSGKLEDPIADELATCRASIVVSDPCQSIQCCTSAECQPKSSRTYAVD